jgi:NitT/TauT family transport system ATP-binding protein
VVEVTKDWLVKVTALSFSYPTGLLAIDGLDLSVRHHEVVAVVGPSGGGKSTLLGLLAGLLVPSAGRIEWNTRLLSGAAQQGLSDRRLLSLVFQRDTLLPWLTVEQNVAFGLDYVRIDRKERKDRIDGLLKIAGLTEFRQAYPRQLSGGMRRRVAFLTGVAPRPHLLLLDEPFSALDEPTRVALHAEVLDMIYTMGLTAILVTHDLAEAISLSDRVVVLSQRPAQVAWCNETRLGRPRDVFNIRTTPEYGELYSDTWAELWRVIRGTPQGEDRSPANVHEPGRMAPRS